MKKKKNEFILRNLSLLNANFTFCSLSEHKLKFIFNVFNV